MTESLQLPSYLKMLFPPITIPSSWWQSTLVYIKLWAWFKL